MSLAELQPPNRQVERSERSAEALLDAAVSLVAQGGLAALTFSAIAEESGFSRGLVTARFGSKQGLVDALIRRVWGRLRDEDVVPMEQPGTGMDALLSLVAALGNQAKDQPDDMRAMFVCMFDTVGTDHPLTERMVVFHQAMRTEIVASVERGLSDGSIRASVRAADTAILLVSSLRGLAYQWLLEPESFNLVEAYDMLHAHLKATLAP